jgi:DNA-binding transcriptional MocR family regulator
MSTSLVAALQVPATDSSGQQVSVSKPRKCRTAPGIKTAVIQRRVSNQSKRKIASELGIGRNTVTRILEDSHVEQALECGIQASVGLIPQAIRVAEFKLSQNSENMAIKVLENTIWPLNTKQGKPQDPGLTLAIQNLMGNVTVQQSTTELKPVESAPICVNADTQKQAEQK